jgi:asparagine synthetase B (glutamine-hydrolysing)
LARAARNVAQSLARKEHAAGRIPPYGLSPAAFLLVSDLLAPADETEKALPRPAEFDASGLRSGHYLFRALLSCFGTNIPLLVRIEERNATANGLELCAPFLDHRVVEMALAFPFHQYMKGGTNKAILRHAAAGLLSPEVAAQRRKFHTPGNDSYVIHDLLRSTFLEMLESSAFIASGIWSPRCRELYLRDSATRARAGVWMRIYMVQRWYELMVQGKL